ncbi:unnamed protein product [Protopolystoma xenopodis]|uniref:Uncharacterized protein n=1 Tax=Protopolystoma xenopodis TaxID=117903 RepID=A0A3S5BKS0_9PLAT|nr:unnamed protein product [Protopolystoma xenopodis]
MHRSGKLGALVRANASGQVTCILNRVDPTMLQRRLPQGTQVKLGASQQHLDRLGARRCLLVRKICQKGELCHFENACIH